MQHQQQFKKKTQGLRSSAIVKPVAAKKLSIPPSWIRNDMNKNWVIPSGSWLSEGLTGFLLSDKTVEAYQYSQRNVPIQSLILYPFQVEEALAIEYITPIDRGHVSYNLGAGERPIAIIQVYESNTFKNLAWRMDTWSDGTFSLFSLRYRSYLALEKLPNGSVQGRLIDSAAVRDQMKINFILYGLARTVQRRLSFYHPGTQTFLGLETNPDYYAWYLDAFGAQMRNMKKTAVKFVGTPQPSYIWDFGDVSGSAQTLRGIAPGESFDMDGDGHNALDVNGDDCDDNDRNRFPGNREIADANGHDEDCECNFELIDRDHDGHYDSRSFNRCRDGSIKAGDDCDDDNPAIIPGAMIYISETEAQICGGAKVQPASGMKFIREPNGLARSIPR